RATGKGQGRICRYRQGHLRRQDQYSADQGLEPEVARKLLAMLSKRIIPCLDIKDGRTVKGINFVALRDAGDPVELAWQYSRQSADELVFLDITATHEKRKTLSLLASEVARQISIPF